MTVKLLTEHHLECLNLNDCLHIHSYAIFLAANALTSLHICAGSPEFSLLAPVIQVHVSTTFTCAGPYLEPKYEKCHSYTCMLKFKF